MYPIYYAWISLLPNEHMCRRAEPLPQPSCLARELLYVLNILSQAGEVYLPRGGTEISEYRQEVNTRRSVSLSQ